MDAFNNGDSLCLPYYIPLTESIHSSIFRMIIFSDLPSYLNNISYAYAMLYKNKSINNQTKIK